jgi:hypothetical protein
MNFYKHNHAKASLNVNAALIDKKGLNKETNE